MTTQTQTIPQQLAALTDRVNSNPGAQLTPEQRAEYEKIVNRVCRAQAAVRRAKNKGDADALAKAERSLDRASAARATFVSPFVAGLYAPERVVATFRAPWTGKNQTHGVHVHEVEMRLDHVDLTGPSYTLVRVLSETGAPPEFARKAPHIMGIAWFAVRDQIARGHMRVLADECAG